jgi:hypothetical protein
VVGEPLRQDVDRLIDSAEPHLQAVVQEIVRTAVQTSISPLKKDVDQEAAKLRPVATDFAIGGGCLVVCILFSAYVLRSHRLIIKTLMENQKT